MRKWLLLLCGVLMLAPELVCQDRRYNISGRVYNRDTRLGVPYAAVVVDGAPQYGASADSLGRFKIMGLPPNIYRFSAYSLGYEPTISSEYIVSSNSSTVDIAMVESERDLDSIVVIRSQLSRVVQSPVSMQQIGVQLLERTAGANRDLSKVVQSFPGVAFSPASYRNDLIVRGGSPSENRFYVEGFSLPNINHFSTQGASGGPVGLINADLVREVDLYSGAFPIWSSGSLSSVLDIELRDGNPEEQNFKATLGASEAGVSGSGHFSDKSTYIFSLRRSYLQLLFAALGLPFLPDYIDGQFMSRTRLSEHDELRFLVIGALDNMRLNEDATTESAEYILSYLPQLEQKTLTLGVSYHHFSGSNSYAIYLSCSHLYNSSIKYRDNDASLEENLTLQLKSTERWSTLKSENRSYLGDWTIRYGGSVGYNQYFVDSYTPQNSYEQQLCLCEWGIYGSVEHNAPDNLLTWSLGLRADGSSYSTRTSQLWRYLSPRGALSVALSSDVALSVSSGIYYQLPPFTALSYVEQGEYINRDLSYTRVWETTLGAEYMPSSKLKVSIEGFYKDYGDMLISLDDGIPLSDRGDDYGTVGNEALSQEGDGRAYGVEVMGRYQIPNSLSAVASLTLFRSECRVARGAEWQPSAWDNRFILNASCTYNLPRNWAFAAKVSAIGGAPSTPYDLEQSSLVEVWDLYGQPQFDYSLYHTERLPAYWQVDLRIDKSYYFEKWGLTLYLDIQNILANSYIGADIPISTGEVANPLDEIEQQHYVMKYIKNESDTLLPTIGISIEF